MRSIFNMDDETVLGEKAPHTWNTFQQILGSSGYPSLVETQLVLRTTVVSFNCR